MQTKHTMNSPPRPQRLLGQRVVAIQKQQDYPAHRTVHNSDPVADVQSEMVDRSMSALPSVFTQVYSMQKAQTDDLQRYQTLLQTLTDEINKGEAKKEDLQQELTCVMNKIFQCDETIKDKVKNIRQLESDIKQLVVQVCEEQISLGHQEEQIQAELRKLSKNRTRGNEFFKKVAEYERSHSEEYRRLQEAKVNLNKLKDQYVDYGTEDQIQQLLSGNLESELTQDIKNMAVRVADITEDTDHMKKQIAEEECKKTKLEQTLKVLQKRNTAQMTRLKRQLREIQLRNRQRQTHVTQLRDNISQAESQLTGLNS